MAIIFNSRFLTQSVTGVQRFSAEVAKRLSRSGWDIRFVAPHNIKNTELAEELKVIRYGGNKGHLWEQFDLPRYLRKCSEPYLLINPANTAPLRTENSIVTIYDLSFLRHPEWFSKKFYLYYKFLIPKIARKAKRVITISEFSKSEIVDLLNIDSDKVKIAPCGISSTFLNFKNTGREQATLKYILTVSSLDPRKNLARTINAFKKLENKEIRLVIAGAGNKIFAKSYINELINSDDRIELKNVSNDTDLAKLYANASLFVFPSLYEGFGLPPIEAMACGCPCIVSKTASLPEVCGDAALYCDPYNENDIAEKMNLLLTDGGLRDKLIGMGLKRSAMFSWDITAEQYLKVINESLNK